MRDKVASTSFTIPGRLPGLNEYTNACRKNSRAGARMKKAAEHQVIAGILSCTSATVPGRVSVSITWYEKDRRRDLDNVAFAKKFILDAMVRTGVIGGDDQKHVVQLADEFAVDRANPRIEVIVARSKS